MSLTIKRINADSSFLLTLAPTFAPDASIHHFPGSYTILIDPWLAGPSLFVHARFQTTERTSQSAVQSLAELEPQLDLIVISQAKTDHCHRESLCSLPRDTHVRILAAPAAAKAIRSWKHFTDPNSVQVLPRFDPRRPQTVIAIPLDSYTHSSAPGQITICNLESKRNVTGLHNAIAITYRAPGTSVTAIKDGNTVDLLDLPAYRSGSLTIASTASRSRSSHGSSSASQSSELSPATSQSSAPPAKADPDVSPIDAAIPAPTPTTAQQGEHHQTPLTKRASTPSPFRAAPAPPHSPCPPVIQTTTLTALPPVEPLSIVYSPHGLTHPHLLSSWLAHHLIPLQHRAASLRTLPLPVPPPQITALIHSLTVVANPWLLGGVISTGLPGAIDLLRRAQPHTRQKPPSPAPVPTTITLTPPTPTLPSFSGLPLKFIIPAHDEQKRSSGWATKWLRTCPHSTDEARAMFARGAGGNGAGARREGGDGDGDGGCNLDPQIYNDQLAHSPMIPQILDLACGETRRLIA